MERFIAVDDVQAKDFQRFLEHCLSIDEAAVIRIKKQSETTIRVWFYSPLKVLATRVVSGSVRPEDIVCSVDHILAQSVVGDKIFHTGMAFDSAWTTTLPVPEKFHYLETIPAHIIIDLALQGAELAQDNHGPLGMPPSLLDQSIVTINPESGAGGDSLPVEVHIPMRAIFGIKALALIPKDCDQSEPVHIRAFGSWLRLDARFGSVYVRSLSANLSVETIS